MITGVSTAGKLIGVAAGAAAWAGRGMEIMGNLRALLNTWQRAAARLICRARVFLFVAIALLAQPLHLADAFARARESSPELAASRESVRAAQAAADAAGALSNPTVAATLGPDVPELTATVDVKLPIFQRGFAVAAAERDVEAAQADAQAKSVATRAAVRRAYAALAAAQERAKLAREAFELSADLEKRADSRVQTGMAPQLEAVQAGLARRRAAQERDDRAAALFGAREELGRL